jgi:GNAT superfamily N-acetyltransferase
MTTWAIEREATTADAVAALGEDRRWNGYSLADLDPAHRAWTRIVLARRGAGAATAACLFYRHPAFNSLIPDGDPDGLAAILADAARDALLPDTTYILAREPHLVALERHYVLHDQSAMRRMALDRQDFRPPATQPSGLRRLTEENAAAVGAFYAAYPASTFTPDQLTHGVFYGVWQGDRLLAAAGTHVIAAEYGIAAVGNVFTLPEARGRGYGAATTAGVVAALLAGPCGEVILNVVAANATARAIYTRLGFVEHCPYVEARATLRAHD